MATSHKLLYEKIFGEKYVQETFTFEDHAWTRIVVGKKCCSRCGLLALNNAFTQWAIKHGCNNNLHPSYAAVRLKYSRKG